jgi:hypothetical protein
MPRGIAYDGATDELLVACRGGELVVFPAEGGASTRTVQLSRDLRDVVVAGTSRFVTTFRSAEIIRLSASLAEMGRTSPPTSLGSSVDRGFVPAGDGALSRGGFGEFVPAVAWRAIPFAGGVAMVHQRASGTEVQPDPGGYGGGGTGCQSSIVQSTVTFSDGTTTSLGPDLGGATLPVDMAVSRDGQWTVVVAAGNESGLQSVQAYPTESLRSGFPGDCRFAGSQPSQPIGNAVAVAFTDDGSLLVQQRDPSAIVILGSPHAGEPTFDAREGGVLDVTGTIALGGEDRFDTGHAVFHGNTGAFLACASCHPEGTDDGRTWSFGRIGERRTPAMHGDLRGTEPFHWDGDMRDLDHLVHDVFTGRMSGPELQPAQIDALGGWLDELPAPMPSTVRDADAVARGRSLFYGTAQCGACHSGALYTNNATLDVGTGGSFQVPSLVGVSHRLPVMHDGCARTLEQRLEDPACGGASHGNTSALTPENVADLVSFLETL